MVLSIENYWLIIPALTVFFLLLAWLLSKAHFSLGTKAKSADMHMRWSKSARPTVGGFLFLAALLGWSVHHAMTSSFDPDDYALLWCGIMAFALGLWDDIYRISAGKKLMGQILIALLFAFIKNYTGEVSENHPETWEAYDFIGFVFILFVTVGLMNSVNMLDNMDGISAIASLPVLLIPVIAGGPAISLSLFLIPAMIGFLAFNKPSSSIFMGDSGSMLLGFILSWIIFDAQQMTEAGGQFNVILVLVASCGLYLCDTLLVVFNRLRHGISPARGGRDHSTHNLVYLGLSEKMVALVFFVLAGCETMVIYFLHLADASSAMFYTALILGCFFLLFTIFFLISVRNLHKGKYSYQQ